MSAETDDTRAEDFGGLLCELSVTLLLRMCPELDDMNAQQQHRVFAAMRGKVDRAVSGMFEDLLASPNSERHALCLCALTIAVAGVNEIRAILDEEVCSGDAFKSQLLEPPDQIH